MARSVLYAVGHIKLKSFGCQNLRSGVFFEAPLSSKISRCTVGRAAGQSY